jgi:hypothetical protein
VPLAGLLAVAGGSLPGGLGGSSTSLPPDVASQSLVLALHDNLVVVGLGDAFAKAIVDTPSGSSLADQSAYRAAVELAGSPNIGQVYVDVPDLVTALRSSMTADQGATFDRDVKPYLQPIAAVAMSATGRDGLVRSRIVVSIP